MLGEREQGTKQHWDGSQRLHIQLVHGWALQQVIPHFQSTSWEKNSLSLKILDFFTFTFTAGQCSAATLSCSCRPPCTASPSS